MTPDTAAPTQFGNYDVLAKIAEGGMGMVYKGRSRATGELVAIKVIAPGTARNPVILQRFEREFQSAKVLDHPNVVRAIEYCGTGPQPFLVMEFVDGESLGQRIERAGPLPEAEAVRIVAQICEGLQRAHKQGLVHRDVKPDNILVTSEGVAKLTDMGLVKEVDGDLNLTKTGRGLGTPHYMAPEQFRNAKGVDARSDIYSLGATLYAAVTGVVPFANSNPLDCWMKKIRNEFTAPKELNPAVSDRVDWAIRRAMSAEPAQRPASCREFLEDLSGQSRTATPDPAGATATLWYMVYRDEAGQAHTAKGGTEAIRKALREGLLGDAATILVSRSKTGQFQSLESFPEFRDLIVEPAALPLPGVAARKSGPQPVPAGASTGSDDAVNMRSEPQVSGTTPLSRIMRSKQTVRPPGRNTPVDSPRMPTPTPDTYAETAQYTPTSEPLDRGKVEEEQPVARPERPPFNWTPILFVLVAFLSAMVGYLLLVRR